ncbi:sigma 54-interacting transcriptional regulator [[Clostridium] aminophilum]|uniref:sigma 54-interacting transcriptional regulator n=1 Tax=[Clostridium] aminophilum TaxID=1526 RepID=UPI003F9A299D
MIFLKYNDHMEALLKAALDIFPESIQLYDRNAMAVYFNNAGLSTMDFPHNEIKHKHVLELFEVDADYSTVLTALRTQNRIANRFSRYKARNGTSFTTVNNAWPVFSDGKLLGIVDTEMNMEIIKELSRIEDALKESRLQVNQFSEKSMENFSAESVAMKKLMIDAFRAAQKTENLLISGEEGTETELLAYGISNTGLRKDRPVQVMNCAAIPEELQEQVLLGTESGNEDERNGLLEKADGGILLLEEVGSLSLHAQGILLHVLQGDSFRRIGGSDDIHSAFSVISTTSEILSEDLPRISHGQQRCRGYTG